MRLMKRLQTKYGISHPFCLICVLVCLFVCAFIASNSINLDSYTDVGVESRIITDENNGEWSQFGEELFDTVIGSYSQVVAIGIEPFLAVIIQGFCGLINAVVGMPFDMEVTYFSLPQVLLAVLVFYVIGKLMQCFECTRPFAMLTFGEIERIFGYVLMVVISWQNITKIIYVCDKYRSLLQHTFGNIPVDLVIGAIVFGVGFLFALGGVLVFYITKTMVLGLQILQLSISFLPFTSLLFEVLRSSACFIFVIFNLLFPRMGFAFNCSAFICGILLLSQTSGSVEYFRIMYIESLLMPIYKFRGDIRSLYKDVPGEILKKCNHQDNIIIPVFSMERFAVNDIEISNHEKWWMEIAENNFCFYRKKMLTGKVEMFQVQRNEKQWYFTNKWNCLELFDLNGPEENIIRLFQKPERTIVFAVSREYESVFKDIISSMGATDYIALKDELTEKRRKCIEEENKAFYAVIQ